MTNDEKEELRTLAANVRDDRLRGLIFLLLEESTPRDDWRRREMERGDLGRSGPPCKHDGGFDSRDGRSFCKLCNQEVRQLLGR